MCFLEMDQRERSFLRDLFLILSRRRKIRSIRTRTSFVMFVVYLLLCFALTSSEDSSSSSLIFSDCKHLILPPRCQCYHSGDQSQLRCHQIQLKFLPKLPNNMRWFALDFSSNLLSNIDSYVFSDIYVEKLNFKQNQLREIELTAFDQIQNLKDLFLDQNQLKEFRPDILTYPGITLETFDISFNPLNFLDLGEIFLHLPVLRRFIGKSCELTNLSLESLLKLIDYNHNALQHLDLSSNRFTSLCDEYFRSFSNLRQLNLEKNQIYQLDGSFIRSLNSLSIVNLASNLLEDLPSIWSNSLEFLNVSSNKIRSIEEFFGAELRSIRSIDFDSNENLQNISKRAFCSINLVTLERLSFRLNNLPMIEAFEELFCRLIETNRMTPVIDINSNIYLKCDCMLVEYEKYFIHYHDLTCIQEGQDRYFISKLAASFANCSKTSCEKTSIKTLCQRNNEIQTPICVKTTPMSLTTTVVTPSSPVKNSTERENFTLIYFSQLFKSTANTFDFSFLILFPSQFIFIVKKTFSF